MLKGDMVAYNVTEGGTGQQAAEAGRQPSKASSPPAPSCASSSRRMSPAFSTVLLFLLQAIRATLVAIGASDLPCPSRLYSNSTPTPL